MRVVRVNFNVDEPTINGRIYPKEVFKKAMDEWMTRTVKVCYDWMGAVEKPDLMSMIGQVSSYEITDDNKIMLTTQMLPRFNEQVEELADFTLAILGTVNEDNTVNVKSISHAYLTPKGN